LEPFEVGDDDAAGVAEDVGDDLDVAALLDDFIGGVGRRAVGGFGEDAAGELYALVTNTPANGVGGIVYQITAVPEPSQWALFGLGLAALAGLARRRRAG
jgi:hypothetical protein